jgi:hypothetical protein
VGVDRKVGQLRGDAVRQHDVIWEETFRAFFLKTRGFDSAMSCIHN